jgi:lipoprotein NlpI
MASGPHSAVHGLLTVGLVLAVMTPLAAAEPAGIKRDFAAAIEAFFAARPAESARLFDAVAAAAPDREPELWQRGLAQYYAGRYADGRRQFELHRTVNPNDVENVAWHFACVARESGAAAARAAVLPVGEDPRVPMKQVRDLCAGTATPEDVIAAAEASPERNRRNDLCFAHLYVGLYHDAIGDAEQAKRHILLAAGPFSMDHYMGRVAQVHLAVRGWKPEPRNEAAVP